MSLTEDRGGWWDGQRVAWGGNVKFFFSLRWQLFDSVNVGFLWNEAGLLVRECKWLHWDHKASNLAAPRKGSTNKSPFFILMPLAVQKKPRLFHINCKFFWFFSNALFSSWSRTLSLFYSYTFASSKWRAKPVMAWLSHLLLSCFYIFTYLPLSSVFFFSLQPSRTFVLLPSLHPSQSRPVNPSDGSTKKTFVYTTYCWKWHSFLKIAHHKRGSPEKGETARETKKGGKWGRD